MVGWLRFLLPLYLCWCSAQQPSSLFSLDKVIVEGEYFTKNYHPHRPHTNTIIIYTCIVTEKCCCYVKLSDFINSSHSWKTSKSPRPRSVSEYLKTVQVQTSTKYQHAVPCTVILTQTRNKREICMAIKTALRTPKTRSGGSSRSIKLVRREDICPIFSS